jgi:uncharacterized protein YbjT (DUF2867 family)
MKLLVLGGTVFLGRATVAAALARGHEVTLSIVAGRMPACSHRSKNCEATAAAICRPYTAGAGTP